MQKLIGSILVISACSAMGYWKCYDMKLHLEELEELKKIFIMLQNELRYTKAPFAEVFQRVGNKVNGTYKEWLLNFSERLKNRGNGTFYELWRRSILDFLYESMLSKEELEGLVEMGSNIDCFETWGLYLEHLDNSIQSTREEIMSKKKVYQSMGVMGGIFLVIILL